MPHFGGGIAVRALMELQGQLWPRNESYFRDSGRKVSLSLGKEWYLTAIEELLEIIAQCNFADLPPDRVVTGADETIEEGFAGLMAGGATIEMGMVSGQAAVSIGIRYPKRDAKESDTQEPR
jgi:hypothetical protein